MNDLDTLDTIGELSDKLDNVIFGSHMPLPPEMHVEQMRLVMMDVRDRLRQVYVRVSGENPWEHEGDYE